MSNPADCTISDSVKVKKKYTTWLNMNHCQYIKYKMSNPADCTIGFSVQVKYTTWLNMNHCQNIK